MRIMPECFDKPVFKTLNDLEGMFVVCDEGKNILVMIDKINQRFSIMVGKDETMMGRFVKNYSMNATGEHIPKEIGYCQMNNIRQSEFRQWLKENKLEIHIVYGEEGKVKIGRLHLIEEARA